MRASLDIRPISASSISYLVGNWAATPRRTHAVVVIIEDIMKTLRKKKQRSPSSSTFFLSPIFFIGVEGLSARQKLADHLTAQAFCRRRLLVGD
jgi:hypothetical protein